MAGKVGQKSDKPAELSERYHETFITDLDQRTAVARTLRERLQALQSDLGGTDYLSYQRRSLTKRAVHLEARIEQAEAALARGEDADVGSLTQAINTLVGLYRALGFDRVARDPLHDYLQREFNGTEARQ